MKTKIQNIIEWFIFASVFINAITYVFGNDIIGRIFGTLMIIALTVWATLAVILKFMKKWESD